MLPNNKKLSILYTLQILKDYTDENNLLTQNEIANKLYSIYGMQVERKTIGSNVDQLIDFGFDIVKTKNGCFLFGREFEPTEIQFLVDAVFSSPSISGKQAKQLATKISSLLSVYKRGKYNYIYKAEELNRTNNKELFYNIEILNEAIENKKQVQFEYDKVGNTKSDYIINPYCLINRMGRYYLVCNNNNFNRVSNYKVERIKNIKILNGKAKPITKIPGFENGLDIAKYANENIYMFSSKAINATLKLKNENSFNYVDDWFGKRAKLFNKKDEIFVNLVANEKSLIFWCLQYGEEVELVEPKLTREIIKKMIENLSKKYK